MFIKNYGYVKIGNFQQYRISSCIKSPLSSDGSGREGTCSRKKFFPALQHFLLLGCIQDRTAKMPGKERNVLL